MVPLSPSDRALRALAVLIGRANDNAKRARATGDRVAAARFYRAKDALIGQALQRLDEPDATTLRYHAHAVLGVEVLLRLPLPGGKHRCFHAPVRCLSRDARARTFEFLGDPNEFLTTFDGVPPLGF